MFDTIYLKTPLVCPDCGVGVSTIQTHHFGETMEHIKVGSITSGGPVLTGILKETLWCDTCYKDGKQPADSPVYLIVWHSILAGVEQDLRKAEERLHAVDRLDLISWLDEAQREAAKWQGNFHHLYSDISRWHEHLNQPPAGDEADTERARAFRRIFSLPEEILKAPDPLAAILASHKLGKEGAED